MTIHKIDLAWTVGDRIKPKRGGYELAILGFDEDGNAYGTTRNGPKYSDIINHTVDDPDNWQLACHCVGAPFERKVMDTVKVREDGFISGFYYGLKDLFYQAGGPLVTKLHTARTDCRHHSQHDEITALENKIWRAAWRLGQEKARMKKPLDFTKALRLRDRDALAYPNRKVHYVGALRKTPDGPVRHYINLSISDSDPPEWQDGREFAIDEYGAPLAGSPSGCWIENIPEVSTYGEVIQASNGQPISLNITVQGDEVLKVEWVK